MKQLLSLFLFLLPCLAWAQYPSNGNQKITLGEQTTADGLIWRGVAADTTLTAKSDTAAYFVLDTVNKKLYFYKASAIPKWNEISGSGGGGVTTFSAGTTGLTPNTASSGAVTLGGTLAVANGGTGITSLGTGVATFLGTPSSANLASAVTNETGTGNLVFATQPVFTNTVGIGGATASTSGSGITFAATQSASTNVNTLDDYEEGTWTITTDFSGTNNSIPLSNQGTYTKIGKLVAITGYSVFDKGSGTTGTLTLGGLPFTRSNNPNSGNAVNIGFNIRVGRTGYVLAGYVQQNENYIYLSLTFIGVGSLDYVNETDMAAAGTANYISFSGFYVTE
jgi:hypothetical protein